MSWVPIDINEGGAMTTKEDDAARAKSEDDEKRKAAEQQRTTQNQNQPETTQGRSTRGEEVDPRTGLPTGQDYDPTQDPTFNANTAQRFEEPGRAGSEEADEANEEVS
jgi:hypothetical protein